jgi:uncharacterized protein with HEPN domain
MRLNAERALSFIEGKSFEDFAAEYVVNYSVVRALTIIGEAANRVSVATQANLPQLDWSGMIGLRNVVVHDYGRVDLNEIWVILQRDLPPLLAQLTTFLSKHP